ncbi:polycystic kidney disease protein 1-like 2 isoform X7 [Xiphias gladius]|uniref:polycystic kidney disease protein 1-like 2 isoform X7 n=1 Tax=Xiphias gladius TaxID=8245 RepID=UPI001A98ABE8|nr:polycystic kidney disease protein 1-like 2 isoform X7 [Xiphias gladius]
MISPIKTLLRNITRERNTSNFTWWLGEGVRGEPTIHIGDVSEYSCTYMKLNPLQLIITSECNQQRGFLCTHKLRSSSNTKNTIVASHASRSRLRRNVDAMGSSVTDINKLLLEADKELKRMETTGGEPTNYNRYKFIQYLLEGTKKLTPEFALSHNDTISHIISCGNGILLLSKKKCDIQTNPNPTSLFEDVFEIFRTISLLLGSVTTQKLVIRHGTGTIYQSNHKPADLGNAVLGSEIDGEFIKLPSYSALQAQLGEHSKILAQMATFSRNPHPSSDNISGTLCSLLLSSGVSDIKLANLTEMIEIFMPRPTASALMSSTAALEQNAKALATINVSDPNVTVVFSVEPSANVSLILTLSQGSPPTSTYSNNTTILSPAGGYCWMITPEMLHQTPGVWYVDTRLFNSTWEPGLTLNVTSFMIKCLYWHIEKEKWSTDGCQVTVKLTGSEGESERHTLTDPVKPVFERGAVDMFLLATPFPLGEVRSLRLQHDNSGGHPSWYINKVTIQDLQTQHVWHFLCDCWLSDDHGDGMTKKTFNAAKKNEIASFRNIFQSRTSTGFRDEHIWVSIVDPPSRSPFTRAQRVSCCMSLLLCTMAINIAFWNIPVDGDSSVLFALGSLRITWQEIMVGVESGLLMFPINILIVTIFRSIRPRIISKTQKDNCEETFGPPAVTIATILKDTEDVISLVSRSPRNKMSEMHRLESTTDLCPALDRVHEFIQLMQGESESDPHWVYCSKFLLAGLCHLLMGLDKLDGKNFPSPHEYQRALNITNLLVRKAEMVFSSHLAYCPPPVKKKKKKRSGGCRLPWWCVFLGWFLLLSISGVSTFFTLLYGFQYGKEKSIKWVMSLGLSLFQSIFILQPLKVIGIAVFFALLLKPVAVEETEDTEQLLLGKKNIMQLTCHQNRLGCKGY